MSSFVVPVYHRDSDMQYWVVDTHVAIKHRRVSIIVYPRGAAAATAKTAGTSWSSSHLRLSGPCLGLRQRAHPEPAFPVISSSSSMRTCSSFSIYRHLSPFRHRQVPNSLVFSSAIAPAGSPVHFDPHARAGPTHEASSSAFSTSTPSLTSLAAGHPTGLQHARTLTALHTARELIARILPPQSPESSFWNKVLCEVSEEISRSNLTSKEDKISIVGAF